MPVYSFICLCSLGFNTLNFVISFPLDDSGSRRCVQEQPLLHSELRKAGELRVFMIVINKNYLNRYPQQECVLVGKLYATSFIFFFKNEGLLILSRLGRSSWCVSYTRRIGKVVAFVWSLLTFTGLLGNGMVPFQVMEGLFFVYMSCVFIAMRNMKGNGQEKKKTPLTYSLFFSHFSFLWSLVLSFPPMPNPVIFPTLLWD